MPTNNLLLFATSSPLSPPLPNLFLHLQPLRNTLFQEYSCRHDWCVFPFIAGCCNLPGFHQDIILSVCYSSAFYFLFLFSWTGLQMRINFLQKAQDTHGFYWPRSSCLIPFIWRAKSCLIMYSCLSFRVLPYSLSLYPFSFSLFFVVKLIIPFTCREIFSFFSFFYPIMLGRLLHVVLHSIPILPLITSSTCLVSFCLVSVLFSAIHTLHTYTHTLMFPCCIHGWEKQTTHASSSSSFFFFVPCFALFLVSIAWARFWERFWLID